MPKVSVIIPVYGVEKYIERCTVSLFEQTLDDMEFIFVDDCTPDRSMEILGCVIEKYRLRFAEKNYIVRTERMPTNSGLPAVRRHGIQLATGYYIIHCDSDDWVDIDMYRIMYKEAITTNSDFVICDYIVSDGDTDISIVQGCHSRTKEELMHNTLFQRDPWSLCNKLFKRSAYYNIFYPQGAMGEDMLTTLQLLINCKSFSYIPKGLYYYYTNFNSISKAKGVESTLYRFNQAKDNVDNLLRIFKERNLANSYQMELNYVQYTVLRLLQPTLRDPRCYSLWKETYRGIWKRFLLNPNVNMKDKLKFVLSSIKLYPYA